MPKDANQPPTPEAPDRNKDGQGILPVMTKEAKKRLEELIPETKRIETRRLKDTQTEKANRKEINQLLKQFGLENFKVENKTVIDEFGDALTAYQSHSTKTKIAKGEAPSERVEDDSDDDE